MGVSNIIKDEKNEVRRYLLGQLGEGDEERLELRLLTDPSFGEDFDTIVDEIIDQYVGNELQVDERERVEQHFLRATERQNKVKFACELLHRASIERGGEAAEITPVREQDPGLLERALSLWDKQPSSLRLATIFATVVILAGVVLLLRSGNPPSQNYVAINLKISSSDRSVGSETPVKLQPGSPGIMIELTLPDEIPQAKSYRIELLNDQGSPRDLPIAEQNARSVVVVVPAADVPRGSYIIHLYAVSADGAEQRIRGSYFFDVE